MPEVSLSPNRVKEPANENDSVAKHVVGPGPVEVRKSDMPIDVAMNQLALVAAQWGAASNERSTAGDAVGTPLHVDNDTLSY